MGIALGVAGLATGIYSAVESGSAREEAAEDLEKAQIGGAQFLLEQGERGEEEIRKSAEEALGMADQIAWDAAVPIAPFKEAGLGAYESVKDRILGGDPRIMSAISDPASAAVTGRPEIFDLSGPVGAEVQRQGQLAASGAEPAFLAGELDMAQTGVQAAGDLAAVEMRNRNRAAQLLQTSGAQRASALVGQVAPAADLILGGEQASLLGDIAGGNTRTAIIENLVRLGGELGGGD